MSTAVAIIMMPLNLSLWGGLYPPASAFVVLAVFLHNALALCTGYFAARLAGLPERDRRAVSIEVGIQNSALGLILIFNFFDGPACHEPA